MIGYKVFNLLYISVIGLTKHNYYQKEDIKDPVGSSGIDGNIRDTNIVTTKIEYLISTNIQWYIAYTT